MHFLSSSRFFSVAVPGSKAVLGLEETEPTTANRGAP